MIKGVMHDYFKNCPLKEAKGLVVFDPTKRFLSYIKKSYSTKDYALTRYNDVDLTKELHVPGYELGEYKGIVGISAFYDGELLL